METAGDVPCASNEELKDTVDIDEGQEQAEIEQEIEPLKVAPSPVLPSASEVEEHRVTHAQYRSWCRECVEGKALGEQRGRAADGGVRLVPTVGVDYFFITSRGMVRREDLNITKDEEGEAKIMEERKKGNIVKCLIVRCSKTKAVFAHQVPVKGLDEDKHVVKLVCADVEWLGHTKVVMKCDNEPAVKRLLDHSLRALRITNMDAITQEHPERYESQSNGMVEVGIKVVRGHFRTLKSCLERRIGAEIPASHPVLAWLLEHACLIINAVVRGDDGLSAWTRARGRPFRQRRIGFCENCLYKLPVKGPHHDEDGNMAPR